ncbi:UDP-N-acetylhexosamine pyrophosphorylase [Planctomycetales bacterium]|nr:UDP-N-acetylhexosamine pyrophosphorylase [Planctomycetales bacterium]
MKQSLSGKLKPFGQEHLLTFWDELSEPQQQQLEAQIQSIDFAQLAELYKRRSEAAEYESLAMQSGDPPAYKFSTVTDTTPVKQPKAVNVKEAVQSGEEALRSGKVAAVLVAGGQGTRLGFPHPKGMFPVAPVSKHTLFQIHFEKVSAASKRYGNWVPLCIMTSPATDTETRTFLAENNYFGLDPNEVLIFCQGTMPAVSMEDGRVLLAEKEQIAVSPDGHGGMLAALTKGTPSVLQSLKRRGIEYLFYNQVDNPLVRIASPEMLGFHILSGSELTSQVIRKTKPLDKVGNIVQIGDRQQVIEYSDLPESAAKLTQPDGSLKIWAGSIAVHVFNTALLERESKNKAALPFHIARKKVPFVDLQTGELQKPAEPNAVKFERFIFDLLPSAKNAVVIEVDSPNHYAPLKNAPGSSEFAPETVARDIALMHTAWLKQNGVKVKDAVPVEISPLFADSPEALQKKELPKEITEPVFLR